VLAVYFALFMCREYRCGCRRRAADAGAVHAPAHGADLPILYEPLRAYLLYSSPAIAIKAADGLEESLQRTVRLTTRI